MDSQSYDRRRFLGAAASTLLPATVHAEAYPLFRAEGPHRRLGRQHGEQAASRIREHLEYVAGGLKLSRECLRARAARFRPLFAKHCPHLLEEIEGLAEGAGISAADALAVNIRGELGHAGQGGCTAYAVAARGAAAGGILIGQNSDMPARMMDLGYVLHLKPENKPEVLMWTFGGMIGYHGMNSAGVAHFANALGGGPEPKFALPHYPLKRLMLECATVAEIAALFGRAPLASNGNYVLCDGLGEIADIEATTEGAKILRDGDAGFLVHTNHFLAAPYASADNHAASLADSFPRLERMNGLVKARFGRITVEDVEHFLSDHAGQPQSICRHGSAADETGQTVASIVAEPARGRMHVARGNPCANRFREYSLEPRQPLC